MDLVEQNDDFLTDIKENFKAQTATEVEVLQESALTVFANASSNGHQRSEKQKLCTKLQNQERNRHIYYSATKIADSFSAQPFLFLSIFHFPVSITFNHLTL
jgi:hypothetical protein